MPGTDRFSDDRQPLNGTARREPIALAYSDRQAGKSDVENLRSKLLLSVSGVRLSTDLRDRSSNAGRTKTGVVWGPRVS